MEINVTVISLIYNSYPIEESVGSPYIVDMGLAEIKAKVDLLSREERKGLLVYLDGLDDVSGLESSNEKPVAAIERGLESVDGIES